MPLDEKKMWKIYLQNDILIMVSNCNSPFLGLPGLNERAGSSVTRITISVSFLRVAMPFVVIEE